VGNWLTKKIKKRRIYFRWGVFNSFVLLIYFFVSKRCAIKKIFLTKRKNIVLCKYSSKKYVPIISRSRIFWSSKFFSHVFFSVRYIFVVKCIRFKLLFLPNSEIDFPNSFSQPRKNVPYKFRLPKKIEIKLRKHIFSSQV